MRVQKKKVNRQAKKQQSTSPKHLFIGILIIVLFLAGLFGIYYLNWLNSQRTTAPSDEKYYFADSRYAGIRSKFVTRNTAREKVSIEYPVTKNEKINHTIANTIDKTDRDFRGAVLLATTFDQPLTETISYQVTHNNSVALSIIVNIKQDMHDAHPVSLAHRFQDVKL